jgi:threonine dehydratase
MAWSGCFELSVLTGSDCLAVAHVVQLEGRTLIHPFDDPLVIAGQGTIGMEIVRQCSGRQLTAIFCCVGEQPI